MTTTPTIPMHLSLFPFLANVANEALAKALTALPGHDELEAALPRVSAALDATRDDLAAAMHARQVLLERVTETVRAGTQLPSDLPAQAGKCSDALTRAQAAHALVTDVERTLAGERDQVLAAAPDVLLKHLNGQLRAVVTKARALDLAGAATADDAIETGRTDAWTTVMRLHAAEQKIRDAQGLVMTHLVGGSGQHWETFGLIRNYAEIVPRWFERHTGRPMSILNGEPVPYPLPWPEDPRGFWLYVVNHPEVEPWIPTARQMADAYNAAHAEARQAADAREREDQAPLSEEERQRRLLNLRYLANGGPRF